MVSTFKTLGSYLQSTAICLFLLSAFGGVLRFWNPAGPAIIPVFSITFCLSTLLAALGLWKERRITLSETPFLLSLLLLTFSSFFFTAYTLFPAPTTRGEILCFAAVFFIFFRHTESAKLWRVILILGATLLGLELYRVTGGMPIFSDDHATFIFRFTLLQKQLFNIPFYYPMWNGGLDARDFFATGALNTFLLFSPLYAFFSAFEIHTFVVGALLFLIVPASAYYGGRLLDASRRASSISALLAISSSLFWYRWALKYGTLGFITSAALLPLGFALGLVLLDKDKSPSYRLGVLAIAVLSLIICWSLSAVVFLPLAALTVGMMMRLIKKPVILFVAAGLLILNAPWICVMWEASSVGRFISIEKAAGQPAQNARGDSARGENPREDSARAESTSADTNGESDAVTGAVGHGEPTADSGFRNKRSALSISQALKNLRDKATTSQPLILLFALPGLFLFSRLRFWAYFSTLGWLIFLGTFGVGLKPQLELDRMLIFAGMLAALPAALFLERCIAAGMEGKWWKRALVSHALAYAVVGLFAVAAVLNNRSVERYSIFEAPQAELARRITELTPKGRALFSGFVLHEFGGGHIAPLPLLTSVPMVASSPFHNKWKYTNVIPDQFIREGDAGIERFILLNNVSTILAHEKAWRDYFIAHPDKYHYQGITAGFVLFTVNNFVDSYVLQGSAEVATQKTDGIEIIPHTKDVTVKFTYLPFLEANPCKVRSADQGQDLQLVELYDCTPDLPVFLTAKNPLRRILEH